MKSTRSLLILLLLLASLGVSSVASAQTNTCFFLVGPKQGTTQQFPAAPYIPIGSPCNDGIGSRGIGTQDGEPMPVGTFNATDTACTDIVGRQVPYVAVLSGTIPKTGLATMEMGRPVIKIVGARRPRFSPIVWVFLLAHECGHHALGQVVAADLFGVALGPPYELAADCFAMHSLRAAGEITPADVDTILRFIHSIPGDSWNFPGPERARRLLSC